MGVAGIKAAPLMPTWLVTTRHRVRVFMAGDDAGRGPFGTQHAKRAGASFTACGEAALGWELFWTMPFPGDPSRVCEACRAAIGEAPSSDALSYDVPVDRTEPWTLPATSGSLDSRRPSTGPPGTILALNEETT